ncbi:Sugar/inositol transporter [Niveomyces insectorum RCEF 264]|uniref:Quinate transporter n=1 Tax=Niveomyces insectorum RCEF 264 TaxID=1081102 RepID=A0A167SLI3_9HYPO|nr:Sugar/inositol transporter [Niveomyces insectorum RCEF 264]
MNFYSPPPVIKAELYVRVPDEIRCLGEESEWKGGTARTLQGIFIEGPVADVKGNIYFVDIPYGRILKIDSDKTVTVCARWDGEPNGLAATKDGDLLVADYKQRFKGPNDLIVDSKDNVYFTDQGQTGMTDPTGKVYRLSPDGKLDTLVDNGVSPNGLALSPDEKYLYVAMTRSNQVWRLPLHPDGTTSKVANFFQSFGTAGPDGLAFDEEGNLFICHPSLGSVFVVDPTGVPKARIVSGTKGIHFTNCCFGGPENKTLYITDSLEGAIQKISVSFPLLFETMRLTNPFAVPEGSDLPKEVFGYRPYLLAFSTSWAAACFGYDAGFIGGTLALPSFERAFGLDTATASALAGLQSNIVTTFHTGGFFGSIIGYFVSSLLGVGRRPVLVAAMCIFTIGSVLEMIGNVGLLYTGRAFTGLGVGGSMVVLPIYIAECSPSPIRGRLVGIFEIVLQIALVFGFWVNYGVQKNLPSNDTQWRIPIAIQFIPAGCCIISMYFMIESPRWLLSKGRTAEARKALAWVRHLPEDHEFVESEISEVQAILTLELEDAGDQGQRRLWRQLLSPGVRNRVILSLLLMLLQQLTGIGSLNYFSPLIFKGLGYSSTRTALLATGVYGIVKMISSLIFTVFIVDRFGRRPALLVGCVVMAVCMFYIGIFSRVAGANAGGPGAQASLAMVYIYIIANSASWTSIPWVFASETFPTRVRGLAMMFPNCMQYLGQFTVVYSLPYMINAMGYGTYLFYAVWIVIAFFFAYFFVPETKGVALEDMDLLFDADAPIWAKAARKRYDDAHAAGMTAAAIHQMQRLEKTGAFTETVEKV